MTFPASFGCSCTRTSNWGKTMSDTEDTISVDVSDEEKIGFDDQSETYYRLNRLNANLMERNYTLMMEKLDIEKRMRELTGAYKDMKKKSGKMVSELKNFRTPPFIVGEIIDVLQDDRLLVKNGIGHYYVVNNLSESRVKDEIEIGKRVMMDYKNLNVVEVLPPSRDPIVSGAQLVEKPEITFDDIGGLDEQKFEIRETVELPLLKPDSYRQIGIDPPRGILLVGPPGNGKTLLARAVANKTDAVFIRLVGSELVQKFIGEGGRLVRELFQLAREKAPSIVFIDEIDAIGARRLGMDTSGDREVQRTLMQLLAEMDGFNPLDNVSIIAATNRPDILDRALLRPGRFDRIIEIPQPDDRGVGQIMDIHSRRMNLDWRVKKDMEKLVGMCSGFSGAEIKNVCTEAGMFAVRVDGKRITIKHFKKSIEKVNKKRKEDRGRLDAEKSKIYQ